MLACCRWSFSNEGEAPLRDLARIVDGEELRIISRRHRVQGLVYDALARLGEPLAKFLSNDAQEISMTNLRICVELRSLSRAFRDAALEVRVIKGMPLAARIYPRPFAKTGVDIDLLVAPSEIKKAASILSIAGYRCTKPTQMDLTQWHKVQKESVWFRPADAMTIELHDALVDQASLIPGIGIATETVNVAIQSDLTLPTFNDADQFAYLSLHGINSLWFRAKWLIDVAALLYRANDTEKIYWRAVSGGSGPAPAVALRLCATMMGTTVPGSLAGELESFAVRRLASAATSLMVNPREPTDDLLGTLPIHRAQLAIVTNPLDKIQEIRRQAVAAVFNLMG